MLRRPCQTLRANQRAFAITRQHDIARIAIELMPERITNPHSFSRCIPAFRDAGGAVLRHAVRHDRHPPAVFHGLVEGGRDRCVLDRADHGRPPGDPVYGATAGDRPCGTASGLARGHHRDRLCHRPGLFHPGHPASAGAGVPDLRPDLLPVDAHGTADGCLCVAGRETLRPQLRTVAAVGLGRLRPRRAGLRGAVRPHRRPEPDLDHCRLGRAGRAGQPRAAAAGRHPDGPPGHRQRERAAARRRLYRDHRGVGADPGQPCRLLHFRVDCLATSGISTG